MENISLARKVEDLSDFFITTVNGERQNSIIEPKAEPVNENLILEGGENYLYYMKRLGLLLESDVLILSSRHHYYYDHNDLKGVKLLINIKKLNYIKHLDSFIHVVSRMLPHDAFFIGSFSNKYLIKRREFPFNKASDIFSGFMNYLNSGQTSFLNENIITRMFESHGLKILDMTETDGQTYFSTSRANQAPLTKITRSDFS